MTIADALKAATELLAETLTPQLDAEVLLGFTLQQNRSWLLTHPSKELSKDEIKSYKKLIQRRIKHEPIAYITGKKAFYGREFEVTPAVLIPRPESELLLELAKAEYRDYQDLTIADIGTGSGCLAISISHLFPEAKVIGVDTNQEALTLAEKNAKFLHAPNVTFLESNLLDLFEKQEISLNLILANLPYLTDSDLEDSITAKDLSYEPKSALVAEDNGFALMKECAKQAVKILKDDGCIYFEMMPYQTQPFVEWVKEKRLPYKSQVKKDLADLERVVILKKQ